MSSPVAAPSTPSSRRRRPARDLHPGAWWLWSLGLAAAASATTNPLLLLVLAVVAGLTVALRRSDQPWSASFRLYLVLAAVVVGVRIAFRVLLGGGYGSVVLLDLPTVPLPGWAAGLRLLGPVTLEAVLGGLYEGLRLGTILLCVGAANSLANPKRLLKSMPPALYEVGTAVVVAVALLPQLADSLRRVRAARQLRGVPGGRVGRLRGVVVPVMEDALERSLALAAGMDARGYGRAGALSVGRRRTTGALVLAGLVGICLGTYALLDQTAPRWLVAVGLVGGVVLAGLGFWSAGRRVQRTRYRPDRWRPAEVAVAASGLAAGLLLLLDNGLLGLLAPDPTLHPDLTVVPQVGATALVAVLLGLGAAVAAPEPVLSQPTGRPLEVGRAGAA